MYTVKEIAELANVTVKTLHHYHHIGLLVPKRLSDAGYRLYGVEELERLQEILFYRELDFPLQKIKQLLNGEFDRLSILSEQKILLLQQKHRMERLVQTIDESIASTKKGEVMDSSKMFEGFKTEKEWREALAEQNQYLKEKYDFDMLENNSIEVEEMNESAQEAKKFMQQMATALVEGLSCHDGKVQMFIQDHITFLNGHGHQQTPANFAAQTRFFLTDDFHRKMLESMQTGLSYFLCLAAEAYASN